MDAARKSGVERILQELEKRGYSADQDTGSVEGLLHPDPCERPGMYLSDEGSQMRCSNCGESFAALECVMAAAPKRTSLALLIHQEFGRLETAGSESPAETPELPHTRESGPEETPLAASGSQPAIDAAFVEITQPHAPRGGLGEHLIIGFLSGVFLIAGLMAAAASGFANYQAFGAMVDDPLQARVWAWTGIIASVCSFGGFTFVYWHGAARRWTEAARAMVFALAGALTSIVGTQMYMAGIEDAREVRAEVGAAEAALLEDQVADWRRQLDGIPPETRSIDGLEAYIAEVERIGRTDERPYRAALDELGQARRRAELEARIADARSQMAARAAATVQAGRETRGPFWSWFIAVILEVFSSQATSIGFVALMILAGGRRREAPG